MADALFQAICRTGVFMICAQAVVHFRPREAYEKYLKLIVSVMILLQLFLPLGGLSTDTRQGTGELLGSMVQGLEAELEAAAERARKADRLLEEMTLEEVRRRMQEAGMTEPDEPQRRAEEEETENLPGEADEQSVGEVEPVVIEISVGGVHEKQYN